MADSRGNPEKSNVEVNPNAGVSRKASCNLAIDETEAVEAPNRAVAKHAGVNGLSDSAEGIAQRTMGRGIRGLGIH